MDINLSHRYCALIADDDPVLRHIMAECLEAAGYDVVQTCDGEEAFQQAQAAPTDVFIVDAMMPGIDGFELCTRLRSTDQYAQTPILLATSLEDVEAVDRAYEAGATYFITKPINWTLLIYHLKYLMRASNIEKQLVGARQTAEASNRAKSKFLATVSHELRTPLNAIIGFSQLMTRAPMDVEKIDQYQGYADHIYTSGQHLLEVINTILDISAIESGSIDLEENDFDLAKLAHEVIDICRPIADQKDLALNCTYDGAAILVQADQRCLRQVLINLVSNALNFTAVGHVNLNIRRKTEGLEVCVKDTGIGISPDELEDIFEPFVQSQDVMTRTQDGTGLGLTISRELIKLHGGTITVDSTVNEGSCFCFSLPETCIIQNAAGKARA